MRFDGNKLHVSIKFELAVARGEKVGMGTRALFICIWFCSHTLYVGGGCCAMHSPILLVTSLPACLIRLHRFWWCFWSVCIGIQHSRTLQGNLVVAWPASAVGCKSSNYPPAVSLWSLSFAFLRYHSADERAIVMHLQHPAIVDCVRLPLCLSLYPSEVHHPARHPALCTSMHMI